jgi:hypothetical protein
MSSWCMFAAATSSASVPYATNSTDVTRSCRSALHGSSIRVR